MPKFLFLYHGGCPVKAGLSPEEMQAFMAKWGSWVQDLIAKGVVLDGNGLHGAENGGSRIVSPDKVVSNGPFPEAKEIIGGYNVVNAADLDEAARYAQGCPMLDNGGTVEVRVVFEPQD